ncbi:hypothetical protein BBK82_03725 [Lentzea guizhouensis]|uniref:HTH cro/C1-type domain-containing protein n=1 Tax=Lentzea guizhouensis TaxID=1586287 RepID=A0A1B2HCC2_9PSEU|nr:helix-turn-helix transcriptional regulator [Lentzea guizhouensis]ANZ35326.1 hypothetical protein BBK82_03725 [Lentzea guizhouensis]
MPQIAASDGLELIASEALAKYMRRRGESVRSLAIKVNASRAMIGRLRSGRQVRCRADVARVIEKELSLQEGQLFVAPIVSRVSPKDASDETVEVPAA